MCECQNVNTKIQSKASGNAKACARLIVPCHATNLLHREGVSDATTGGYGDCHSEEGTLEEVLVTTDGKEVLSTCCVSLPHEGTEVQALELVRLHCPIVHLYH